MRSNRKAFLSTLFFSVFITTIFILSIPAISFNIPFTSNSVTSALGDDTTASSPTPGNSFLPKITSEEETIDSFDVNAKSGRWAVTDSNTDDSIQSSNLRVINSANSTSDSSYFAQRGLVKSDSKVEFRAKSSVSGNTSEYFRDILGDSADFDEGDTENWVATTSSTVTQTNGMLKAVTTVNNRGTVYSFISPYLSNNIFTNISFDIYCLSASSIRVEPYYSVGSVFGDYVKDFTCPTTLTHKSFLFSTFTGLTTKETVLYTNIQIIILSATGTIYLDNIEILGGYDYATNVNGAVEDTFDFEDSKEYSYDVLGNVTDFDDGTTEGMQFDWFPAGCASDDMVVTNNGSNYLQITTVNNGVCDSAEVNKTGLSISASTYNYFAVEVYSNTDLSNFAIYDASNNLVYTDTTNVLANTWHLYSGQIVNAAWTGTETAYKINLVPDKAAYNTSDYVLFNFIYLYDSSLGDVESFTVPVNVNQYVDPTGYLINRITSVSSPSTRTATTLSIDTSIFKYATIRIKADSSSLRYFALFNDNQLTPLTAITTSFQTLTFDLSSSSIYWSGTVTYLKFRYYSTSGGGSAIINSVFTVDYILLTADAPSSQEPFTLGFWDQDNSQALVNITQHYFDVSTFRWNIEIYDSGSNVAAYYYSSNQTSVLSGYPAVDSDLYVDGFSSTSTGWNTTGTTPFLDSVDSNNIFATTNGLVERWFTFADISSSFSSDFTTTLNIYVDSFVVGDVFSWAIDTSFDNTPECYGSATSIISGWNVITPTVTCLDTTTEINSARLSLTKINSNGVLQINSAYLNVLHDSTEVNPENFYRGKITYNIHKSLLAVEIQTDGQSRIFKADYPGDFTVIQDTNAFFSHGKAPDIFFDSRADFISASETWIDFINVAYKEREWTQIITPNSTNVITDTWNSFRVQDNIDSQNISKWQLIVPRLDAVSFQFFTNTTNNANLATSDEVLFSTRIYNSDATTGTLQEVLDVNIGYRITGGSTPGDINIQLGGSNIVVAQFGPYTSPFYDMSPGFALSVSTLDDRSILSFQMRFFEDMADLTNFTDYQGSVELSSISSDYSNEFVIETEYDIELLTGNVELYALYTDFFFLARDIFQDIANGINNIGGAIIGGLGGIFQSAINWLFEGLKSLFLGFFAIIKVGFDSLGTIILGGLASLGTTIISGLTPLFNTITGAIGTLASEIGTALDPFFASIAAAVENIVSTFVEQGMIDDFIDFIINSVASFITDIYTNILVPLGGLLFAGVDWLWNNVALPLFDFFGLLWPTVIQLFQDVANTIFTWLLDIFNLLGLYNEASSIFTFLIGIVFYLFCFVLLLSVGGPFIMSKEPTDIYENFIMIWGFDATFGISLLGFHIYIPAGLVYITIFVTFGFSSTLLYVIPW